MKKVHLLVNPVHLRVLEPRHVKYTPASMAAAKFSLPYSAALALRYGRVTLDLYSEAALQDPILLDLADKVTYEVRQVESGKPDGFYFDDHVEIWLTTEDAEYHQEIYHAAGSIYRPMEPEQLRTKFMDCISHGEKHIPPEEAEKLIEQVASFEKISDVGAFLQMYFS